MDNLFEFKIGDKFKSENFLGWIYITGISSEKINLKLEHVSGSDYFKTENIDDFKCKKYSCEYHSFVRI